MIKTAKVDPYLVYERLVECMALGEAADKGNSPIPSLPDECENRGLNLDRTVNLVTVLTAVLRKKERDRIRFLDVFEGVREAAAHGKPEVRYRKDPRSKATMAAILKVQNGRPPRLRYQLATLLCRKCAHEPLSSRPTDTALYSPAHQPCDLSVRQAVLLLIFLKVEDRCDSCSDQQAFSDCLEDIVHNYNERLRGFPHNRTK